MPKRIIGDGGGDGGGGGGMTPSNIAGSPIEIAGVEILFKDGVDVTTYPEQGRIVMRASLARAWFVGT